ncbi:MAG: tRNA lysidine(34) synthetase TilS [Actinomycetota bacterium]|nr:tRNA lysidine(34) synthetase TilS [Actinomycetota bacterium]
MMGPHPAVAAVRLAVRRSTADLRDDPVLVACSGGADSLALLTAAIFEARATGRSVVGVCVDHRLQDGSAAHTERVLAQMAGLGAGQAVAVSVSVDPRGRGIEAAAREARYVALRQQAECFGSEAVVLLGHTLDDQAETVLQGLVRGSGGRSLAGMRAGFHRFRRPLLAITRAQTEAACRALGVEFWEDPQNADPRFLRSRVRHRVMPVLERELGPGIAAALARTGEMLLADMDALDSEASAFLEGGFDSPGLPVAELAKLPDAVRLRVLRSAALATGCPPGDLFRRHILAVDALVSHYHGQQRIELPGNLAAVRCRGGIVFQRTDGPDGCAPVAG